MCRLCDLNKTESSLFSDNFEAMFLIRHCCAGAELNKSDRNCEVIFKKERWGLNPELRIGRHV